MVPTKALKGQPNSLIHFDENGKGKSFQLTPNVCFKTDDAGNLIVLPTGKTSLQLAGGKNEARVFVSASIPAGRNVICTVVSASHMDDALLYEDIRACAADIQPTGFICVVSSRGSVYATIDVHWEIV